MTDAKQPRLSNILLISIILIMIIMLALQVYMLTELHRPILRPAQKAPAAPELPGAWYEKFKDHDARNLSTMELSCSIEQASV